MGHYQRGFPYIVLASDGLRSKGDIQALVEAESEFGYHPIGPEVSDQRGISYRAVLHESIVSAAPRAIFIVEGATDAKYFRELKQLGLGPECRLQNKVSSLIDAGHYPVGSLFVAESGFAYQAMS